MNSLVLEENFIVSVHDCSPKGMRTYAILRHVQDIAEHHAAKLNVGLKDLARNGHTWVIINWRLVLFKPIKLNTPITLQTWPMGHSPIMAKRVFEGRNRDNGHLMFGATSDWMIIDLAKRRHVNLDQNGYDIPNAGLESVLPAPVRQRQLEGYELLDSVNVRYSSIDVLGHVNNSEYVRWGMDALHINNDFRQRAREIEVSFVSEVHLGDTIDIYYKTIDRDRVAIMETSRTDGRTVFLMQVTFEDDPV